MEGWFGMEPAMYAYGCEEISQLKHQLKLSPARLRLKQIRGIERALELVDAKANYPYELICYLVTGFRPTHHDPTPMLSGEMLIADLVQLAEDLTKLTDLPASVFPQMPATAEELAQRFKVSSKTITRWRRRGLMGVRLMFPDGQSRMAYPASCIRRFLTKHSQLVRKAAAFSQLSVEEKESIIARAKTLLGDEHLRLHEISQLIADETGRAVETVRYTLRRHDKHNPDKAVFESSGKPRIHPDHSRIYGLYQDGVDMGRIAARVNKSPDVVRRIVEEMRAREVLQRPVEFMPNDEFNAVENEDAILAAENLIETIPNDIATTARRDGADPYFKDLANVPLLNRRQEHDLFRCYNYLKCKADRLRKRLDPVDVDVERLETIESLLARAEVIKNYLTRCNLRLVVSVARKHADYNDRFFESISDGNLSLMRAVEKFDYSRGNKFSTYATWAVMKNFARSIPERRHESRRYVTGQDELLAVAADQDTSMEKMGHLESIREALGKAIKVLTDREATVLTRHFGLNKQSRTETLEQIGNAIGVSKERVRQIEKAAMRKLQEEMGPQAGDLLAD
jgi:RNA polymerase sigma factor (sigma-70 family)